MGLAVSLDNEIAYKYMAYVHVPVHLSDLSTYIPTLLYLVVEDRSTE
jgi:hypothetical protein